MIWLELSKAVIAGWIAYGLATRTSSRWAWAAIFVLAVILGQLAAFELGYILVSAEMFALKATDVARTVVIPWSSAISAGVGLGFARSRVSR
ncbi:hypothetical protein [Bradyrhizobium shewense]|uniref:hypothetical protein n=1 Tax=Bradyrhizobium shewense TaxID=1761772 RepID=UPI00101AD926|nr:hypothetical protein [Bradyrhizobium shewense]